MGACLQFQDLVHYHQGSMQAGMLLEEQLRANLDPLAESENERDGGQGEREEWGERRRETGLGF